MERKNIVAGGVDFPNPIIIASCPLTENRYHVLKCAEAGAGGVILKTAANYHRNKKYGKRLFLQGRKGYWAQSVFEREIMTVEEAVELIRSVRGSLDFPIIASVAADELDSDKWLDVCEQMEKAGADMIQLDFFYLPDLVALESAGERLQCLLRYLVKTISVPVVPKININLPADFVFPIVRESGIKTVSLLDSVRVPPVKEWAEEKQWERSVLTSEGTSYFGDWQLPLTLHFLVEAKKYDLQTIAGGGIRSAEDAKVLLDFGADLIQIASMAMFGGWDKIAELKEKLQ